MHQYLPCPRCGSRIINRFQYYDICGCQVRGGLDALSPAEQEMIKSVMPTISFLNVPYDGSPQGREARWLQIAEQHLAAGRSAEGEAVLEAVLLDHPRSEAAIEMLKDYNGEKSAKPTSQISLRRFVEPQQSGALRALGAGRS